MPLVLEIEYLLGVAFAARGPDTAEPDWPPQPDRVFSALVASWAARGESPEERAALEWLERQPAPLIEASAAANRQAASSFVPPNDKLQVTANPAWRTRQPRRFPAVLPHIPIARLVWPEGDEAPLQALDALGRDVAYIGHSASLTRCAFSIGQAAADRPNYTARRRIYPGRLRQLETAFLANRRPSPGEFVPQRKPTPQETVNAFSSEWLVLEVVDGNLDIRAAPLACKALIKTVMSGYEANVGGDSIPAWVSGHETNGSATKDPHLAAVPLAFAGFQHGDGALMGFALVPPRGRGDLLTDAGFRKALSRKVVPGENDRQMLRLALGQVGALDLALTLETDQASLDPRRYGRASRRWATVTPMVLDRHLKSASNSDLQAEMELLVGDACERSVSVRPARVVVDKHSLVQGAPSAYPSGKSPPWMGWRIPDSFASRRLVHAVVEFDEEIAGPLLIGAGRFCGLGLCLPLDLQEA